VRVGERVDWLGVLAIAALGNLSGQDLLSRIFSAQSARVARRACQIAGVAYLLFGAIPVVLGLAAAVLLGPGESTAVLPRLAALSLSPALAVVFTVALASAVFSTVDSALLAPAGVIAQNLLGPRLPGRSALALNRLCVVIVAIAALVLALVGSGAYGLLEDAYALGLVSLFVPMVLGLGRRPRREASAIAAMLVGTGVWATHLALGWETFGGPGAALPVPREIAGASLAFLAFFVAERVGRGPGVAPRRAAQGRDDRPAQAPAQRLSTRRREGAAIPRRS
jgi:Na+/proline symporter